MLTSLALLRVVPMSALVGERGFEGNLYLSDFSASG